MYVCAYVCMLHYVSCGCERRSWFLFLSFSCSIRTASVFTPPLPCPIFIKSSCSKKNKENKLMYTLYATICLRYTNDRQVLTKQLDNWLCSAAVAADSPSSSSSSLSSSSSSSSKSTKRVRAVIAPHAGFSYSGPTAAYAYTHLLNELQLNKEIKRVFILGPSHHVYLPNCAVSEMETLETPLGSLRVDREVTDRLLRLRYYWDEEEGEGVVYEEDAEDR